MALRSSFWVRAGSAASWFPACPAGTVSEGTAAGAVSLVPGVPGRDPAHPGAPPLSQPFLHGPLRPLDRLCDDARIDATGGVQDRFGLHPGEHATAGTLLPPDQDGCFFRGDLDLHAPIISETAQEIHENIVSFHGGDINLYVFLMDRLLRCKEKQQPKKDFLGNCLLWRS